MRSTEACSQRFRTELTGQRIWQCWVQDYSLSLKYTCVYPIPGRKGWECGLYSQASDVLVVGYKPPLVDSAIAYKLCRIGRWA